MKKTKTLANIVAVRSREMSYYLAAIDKVIPEKKIKSDVYDKCLDYMTQSFTFSIYKVFHEYPFYK